MKSKKTRMIVAIAGAVLLLLAIFLRLGGKNTADTDTPNGEPGYEESGQPEENFSPVGTWYSDREQGDVLTLREDGTFSSDWLAGGTYEVKNGTLYLTTALGKTVSLAIDSASPCLLYTQKGQEHTYFTTQVLATESRDAHNAAAQAEQERSIQTTLKILTIGAWSYTDVYGVAGEAPATHTMEISQDTIHAYIGEDREGTYRYTVQSATIGGGSIEAVIEYQSLEDEMGVTLQDTLYITAEEDGYYELAIHQAEFRGYWSKWANISFDGEG